MSVKVTNKMPQFKRILYSVLEDALADGTSDILYRAKTRAPYKKGGLRSDSDNHQEGRLKWRVSFNIEYARFQEFGGNSKRRVVNYSTPGTGKAFLKSSGDEQAGKLGNQFKMHAGRART